MVAETPFYTVKYLCVAMREEMSEEGAYSTLMPIGA